VVIASSMGTYVADTVNFWGINTVKVKTNKAKWFEDSNGNFLKDGEAEVLACDGLAVGTYSVYFKYVFYGDDDSSGTYTAGDTLFQVETSNSLMFELTNVPSISGVNPKAFIKGDRIKIIGVNFGPTQTDGEVYIGKKGQYNDGSPTGGKLQTRIKMWSNTKIKVKVAAPAAWSGKNRYVWVVKDGVVSNAKKIQILP